jgi:hypothetical protein
MRARAALCLILLASLVTVAAVPQLALATITINPATDTVTTSHLTFDFGNPGGNTERVDSVQWLGSKGTLGSNLADNGGTACVPGDPSDSWGRADSVSGQPRPVGDGTTGTWTPRGQRTIEISSVRSEACSGESPATPVRTRYTFFDTGAAANKVRVERTLSFSGLSEDFGGDGVRAYVPALPSAYDEVVYPDMGGSVEHEATTAVGHTTAAAWNQTWFALNDPTSKAGVVILRDPADASEAQLVLEHTAAGSNSSSAELLQAMGSWHTPVTETEYLCFYDAESWTPQERTAKTPPSGCAASVVPIDDAPPTISGEPRTGSALSATTGTWDNASAFAYQWTRCAGATCEPIAGATAQTYTPTVADEGKQLGVEVTATATGGEADTASSELTNGVKAGPPAAPSNTVLPAVTGEARDTERLDGTEGSWTGSPTSFEYQWLRCATATGGSCEAIEGASNGSYVLTKADIGSTIRLRVTAVNSTGPTSVDSAATGIVQPLVIRARIVFAPGESCTGIPTRFDGSSSQTPNPPIKEYRWTYEEVPLAFLLTQAIEPADYPKQLALWEIEPKLLYDGPNSSVTQTFTWNRKSREGEDIFVAYGIYVRDPLVVTLTVTDEAGASASTTQELLFVQEYANESRATCPVTKLSLRNFVITPLPAPPTFSATGVVAKLKCPSATPCAGSLSILSARALAASARKHGKSKPATEAITDSSFFTATPGHSVAVHLKLTKRGRALIKHRSQITAIERLTSVSVTGAQSTRSYRVVLHRR